MNKKIIIIISCVSLLIFSAVLYVNYLYSKKKEEDVLKNIKKASSEEGVPSYSSPLFASSDWGGIPGVDQLRFLVGNDFGADILEIRYLPYDNKYYYAKLKVVFSAEATPSPPEPEYYYYKYTIQTKKWMFVDKEDVPSVLFKLL